MLRLLTSPQLPPPPLTTQSPDSPFPPRFHLITCSELHPHQSSSAWPCGDAHHIR
ncbi:Protein of unknown function [Gryllus bimaculatus]|nr:Protein of unknown function [Gryllus bimaculatus]